MSGGGYGGQAQSYGSPPQGGYGQQQQRYPSAYGGGYGGGPRMGIGAPGAQYGGLTGQQPGFWQEKPGPLTQSDSHYGLRQPWPGQAAPWGFDRWQDKGGGGVVVGQQPSRGQGMVTQPGRVGINPPPPEHGGLGGQPPGRPYPGNGAPVQPTGMYLDPNNFDPRIDPRLWGY